VVAVTSHWADGSRHVPLGGKPYRPARRLPTGRNDPDFQTKPALAWQLIEEARAAGIPFRLVVTDSVWWSPTPSGGRRLRLVVADSVDGEHLTLDARLSAAQIPYLMGLKPAHGTWQQGDDPAHPPAFTPAEAAARLPLDAWERTVRFDTHGKELVRFVTERDLGPSYGPTTSTRLIAATLDPKRLKRLKRLKPESTWYLATSLPLAEVSAEHVDEIDRLRDWIEHYDKPVQHALGWADEQMRPERAIVRHRPPLAARAARLYLQFAPGRTARRSRRHAGGPAGGPARCVQP
jgi:hypothetical protein